MRFTSQILEWTNAFIFVWSAANDDIPVLVSSNFRRRAIAYDKEAKNIP